MKPLTIRGRAFIDASGREVLLRGVNLSGATKMPIEEPTQTVNNFSRHRDVSFVGRPFPREEAREHFERLHHWGFNTLRFLTTWEAIEHAGPGQYDTVYLDYLAEMVALAGEYGFYVFIDPHQDVWSRMTGGDGAPGWTLEAVGFDISTLEISEAAITMQRRYPNYPTMIWPNNYGRLACATMFTLFFAGNRYAPHLKIDGRNVQDFLQDSFINAMAQVAHRLKDMPHVIGYGPLNEPGKGFLEMDDLRKISGFPQHQVIVSPEDALLMGAGAARHVPTVERQGFIPVPTGETTLLNPHRVRAWKDADLWEQVGLIARDHNGEPMITNYAYFADSNFLNDGLIPFTKRYAEAIREVDPEAIIFVESTPTEASHLKIQPGELGAIVNAGHWYDGWMLFSKSFDGELAIDTDTMDVVTGREDVVNVFNRSIARLDQVSRTALGDVPTLIGEFGLAYDINDKEAYKTGDFSKHELALSLYYDALDASLVHSAQWNYTPDNTNRWGDGWNEEDLSIFSRDQQADPTYIHSGGRAVKGFCRPYVQVAAGALKFVRFDWVNVEFEAHIDVDAAITEPTLIYVPEIWFAVGCEVNVSSGATEFIGDRNYQMLVWRGAASGMQTLKVKVSES